MLVVDATGLIVFANAATSTVFGHAPSTLVGQPVEALIPQSARARHQGHVQRFRERPGSRPMGVGLTLSGLRADGSEFAAEVSLNPTADGLVVASIRDVSERLRASHRLATLGILVSGVAHELTNPVAALLNNLEELERARSSLPEELGEVVDDASACGRRLRDISQDLRLFSRADQAPKGEVLVDQVVAAAVRVAGAALRKKARVSLALEPGIVVEGHEGRLGQLVLNLLINAAQALPPNEAQSHQVTVSLRRVGETRAQLTVTDDGPGIPPHVLSHLFTSFITTKPAGQGTGLGLSICQRIANEHQGRISVESEVGQGARFTVELPTRPSAPR